VNYPPEQYWASADTLTPDGPQANGYVDHCGRN
jgi:hypothetical protein